MRFLISLSAVVILALLALAGCNSKDKVGANQSATARTTQQQPPPNTPRDGAPRITTVELNEALSSGRAIVVDVRNDAAFKTAHIKGAILIPSSEVDKHLTELPRDKMIVTYCS